MALILDGALGVLADTLSADTVKVDFIKDESGGNTASINGATPTTDNLMGRNRIINGDMRIDQRNAGASVSNANGFTLDRWNLMRGTGSSSPVFNVQQSSSVPSGFKNSLAVTVGTSGAPGSDNYSVLYQRIEGFNTSDIGFGASNASSITLSFWVNCSVTGTFGVAFQNNANSRSYVGTYTVSSANTWEYKTITVAGDTSGTWESTNLTGIGVHFDMGVGTVQSTTAGSWQAGNYLGLTSGTKLSNTSGATWYITGVQLEAGSVATSFERRSYGQELALCQRYCFRYCLGNSDSILGIGSYYNSGTLFWTTCLPVSMRGAITGIIAGGTNYYVFTRNGADDAFDSPIVNGSNSQYNVVEFLEDGGLSGTGGQSGSVRTNNASASIILTAEL